MDITQANAIMRKEAHRREQLVFCTNYVKGFRQGVKTGRAVSECEGDADAVVKAILEDEQINYVDANGRWTADFAGFRAGFPLGFQQKN